MVEEKKAEPRDLAEVFDLDKSSLISEIDENGKDKKEEDD